MVSGALIGDGALIGYRALIQIFTAPVNINVVEFMGIVVCRMCAEIITLALKWLIILRLAIKTVCDQMQQVLKKSVCSFLKCVKKNSSICVYHEGCVYHSLDFCGGI